jgi:hypothetical protein
MPTMRPNEFIYWEETSQDAWQHIRCLMEQGVEGCVEPSGDLTHPFACTWSDISEDSRRKVQDYFQDIIGAE